MAVAVFIPLVIEADELTDVWHEPAPTQIQLWPVGFIKQRWEQLPLFLAQG